MKKNLPLYMLKRWFDLYDYWIIQAQRAERLGLNWEQSDHIMGGTYKSVYDLDLQAEAVRLEIVALEKEEKAKGEAKNGF